jgi:hypothetical protein
MNLIISIVDYHGYSSIISRIAVERLFTPILDRPTDEATVAASLPKAELCLKEFERIKRIKGRRQVPCRRPAKPCRPLSVPGCLLSHDDAGKGADGGPQGLDVVVENDESALQREENPA